MCAVEMKGSLHPLQRVFKRVSAMLWEGVAGFNRACFCTFMWVRVVKHDAWRYIIRL